MFHRIQKFIQKKLDEKRYTPLSKSDCEDQIPEHSVNEKDPPHSAHNHACTQPEIRHEWRALSSSEKEDFIQAVNCLSTVPTTWRTNGTLYDDYAFLHGGIGSWSHRSASFLPWHRYTLYTWQKALKEHCGFKGTIPYWNWELDWHNLSNSSIWSNSTGFGGDGDRSLPITVGEGRCVTDGPFKDLRPIMYNHTFTQHCLSRGFRDGDMVGKLPREPFGPESIGGMMRNETYKGFIRRVEFLLHNRMHSAIGGDFLALTAANDPIFFVHHAQIDRIWWKWQLESPSRRLHEYEGKHMYNSTGEASVDDVLVFGGLVEDIPVSKVMSTENGFLCYRYG
ncbi:hypothetical protein DL95DRAFT_421170 [Leptodontidium sp. 2 PMI_412]|nr:hypothetical protein DL95DRAFT_421170 [Leptodontidium sp. 2 PMI_412]